MTKPLVSICIPTYNGEVYLRQCLDSCLNQNFENYEVIICDDGSSDQTISIIEEYAGKHEQIRFFKNRSNLGLVGNWNRCIELATGDWIKFVFQDDYVAENCLEEFVKHIDDKIVFMICERNFILPESASSEQSDYYTNTVRTLRNTIEQNSLFYSAESISKGATANIAMNFIAEPTLIFFRKDIVNEIGYFNPTLKQICDLEFALRAASRYGLKLVPQKLCAFRIHETSTTSTNLQSKYFDLHYIEPILFSWHLLFGKEFTAFRKHIKITQLWKLKIYFYVKTYRAYLVNVNENRQHPVFTPANKEFKEIYRNRKGNLLVKIIAALV